MPSRNESRRQGDQRQREHAQGAERPLLEVTLYERVVRVEHPLRVWIDLVVRGNAVGGIHPQTDARQWVLDEQPRQVTPIGQPPGR